MLLTDRDRFHAFVLLACVSGNLVIAGSAHADDAATALLPAGISAVGTPPAELKVPAFYTKHVSANGYPITASRHVSDYALYEAAYLVNQMLAHRPDVRDAMIAGGSRMCIMAFNEYTTDLPEFTGLRRPREFSTVSDKDYWDARARGLGGSQYDPLCSCGEENLLGYPGDPYQAECILIHEFAHNIHLRGMVKVDATFDGRVKLAYDKAMADGLWKGVYASVNHHEYFAEGVQSWFDNNRAPDHDHNHVDTRAELVEYDPGLAGLCREVFGETVLKYTRPATRLTGHLAGYDPSTSPRFEWPQRLAQAQLAIRRQAEQRNAEGKKIAAAEKKSDDPPGGTARAVDEPRLTLDRLFKGDEFNEQKIGMFLWSQKSPSYFKYVPVEGEGKGRDLVRVDIASDQSQVVVPAAAFIPADSKDPIASDSLQFSDDESKLLLFTNTHRVWRHETRGDYWLLDVAKRELKKLGGDSPAGTMLFAKFSPDGSRVAYVRENNIYIQDLASMQITPLTTNGSPTLINGTGDWVNEEELDIRDGFRFSPDGQSIAFWQFDVSGVREVFLFANTNEPYSRPIAIPYPKVGEQNSATRLGVVSSSGGDVRWLNIPGDPRQHYLPRMEWSPEENTLLVQQLNRLQNQNRVMLADGKTGQTREVLLETDPAWVDNDNPVRWIEKGKRFVWLSERDGWRHIYLAGRDDQTIVRVTEGDFDVIQIESVDEQQGVIYFAASPENPTQRFLFRVPLNGGKVERMTPADQRGWHTYNIAKNAQWAIHTWSNFMTPPVSELIRLSDHSVVRTLTNNQALREKLSKLDQPELEFLRVDIGENTQLDAWRLRPPRFNSTEKYPLLFYVYGEPAGQTVADRWTGTRGLWNWLLAQQGFLVVSVDNRGTNTPRGRAWRKSIYRQVGIIAPEEQAAAARALLKQWPYADPGRVGIWGWSGGGSMSLLAILRFPDLYQTAIAVAPNPDERLYDTIYQERYMGLPADNADGYRRGSPVTYADQLKGNLLLVHGTGDDNCHFRTTEILMDELIAHGKHFSVIPYPGRTHSLAEGRNTTRHLYGQLTRYLEQHLHPQIHATPTASNSSSTK